MQLSSFTDYSLRVLIYAAVHRDRACRTAEVASAFGISRHHLVKVVNRLEHLGYLETTRGRRGGFRLGRLAERSSVGDVVRAIEGRVVLAECFDPASGGCPLTSACGLQGVLAGARDAFFAALDRASLASLVADARWTRRVVGLRGRGAAR